MKSGYSGEQTMFALSWDVEELKALNTEGRSIHHELLKCIDLCNSQIFEQHNILRELTTIRKRLLEFNKLRGLYILEELPLLTYLCLC